MRRPPPGAAEAEADGGPTGRRDAGCKKMNETKTK